MKLIKVSLKIGKSKEYICGFHNGYISGLADQKQKMIQIIYKYFPEKPVRCFAEAMKNGSSQALRRDILKEFEEL